MIRVASSKTWLVGASMEFLRLRRRPVQCTFRHCEEQRDEAIQGCACRPGLLTWGMCVSRLSSHLFVRLRPPLRPDRGLFSMTRADQVKAGPLGPPRSGLALS